MATTQNLYTGNGSTTNYSFTFEYLKEADVKVSLNEVVTTAYTYANATTIAFTSAPANGVAIRIYRETDIETLNATFFPGSAIKAEDLNENFSQNNYAVQEIGNKAWYKEENTLRAAETWVSSDDQIATALSINNRFYDVDGSRLVDNTLDIQKIKDTDKAITSEYSSSWTGDDDQLATIGALEARHDVVVSNSQPSTTQIGKLWYNTTVGSTALKTWDGSGWITLTSGTPYIPQGTTNVRYVDAINGSDAASVNGFLPQAPLKSIKRAITLINASSSGDGTTIIASPGVYQEVLPLTIQKNNVSVVGESMRSCFIHPTVATENNDMWEVDSGTYITGFTMLGLKVPNSDQGSRNNALDNDATYGLPSNQPFAIKFRSGNPIILKSPYIQNCTHFSDAHFDNATFNPNSFPSTDSQTYSAVAGDETSAPCGGGVLVDGSVPASSSPIRSMVVDAFTQINLDGPGILVTNNGYAQLVSFFGTFCHYHAKAKNGGQINLSNCVSDFGRYGLIADGKSPTAIATATANAASINATTITIGAISSAASFHGTVNRPLDHMLLTIDGNDYGVISSTANGSGWNVVLSRGLVQSIGNTTVSFALRSYISTSGHTFEFVGVGTNYAFHPDKGGVAIEANQVTQLNSGKVWQSSTDQVGKFKTGEVFVVDQVAETVSLKDTTVTGNLTVSGTVNNRNTATDASKLDGIEFLATADQTATEIRALVEAATDSNVFTDADHSHLNNIEAYADVTDSANVDSAGAVMNTDASTSAMSFVVDEDNMSSNTSTKVPTQQSVKAYVDAEVAGVVDSAPGALDTLNELAAALGDDANFSTTVTNSIATKLPLAGGTMTGNIVMSGSETVDGRDLSADGSKLDGIESSATGDQTASEIKTAYESNSNTNAFTDAEQTKLSGIESGATGDQTNAEIRAAVEAATDSNVFTDADHSKLNAIESSATADQTASEIRTLVESASDSNVFTDADHTKLNGVETAATADQTAAEIKTAYESNSNTNEFSDAEQTKLSGIATGATNVTNNNQLTNGAGYVTANTQLSDEEVEDIVGGMLSTNTTVGIAVTYQDSDGTLDFSVASQTDNNFTTTLKNKLDGIAAGAEVNVNADWNATSGDAQILNKPTISSGGGSLVYISTTTVSSATAQVEFDLSSTSYDYFVVKAYGCKFTAAPSNGYCVFFNFYDGTYNSSSPGTNKMNFVYQRTQLDGTTISTAGNDNTYAQDLKLHLGWTPDTSTVFAFDAEIGGKLSSPVSINSNFQKGTSKTGSPMIGGVAPNTSNNMTYMIVKPSTTTFAAGTFLLYGIKNS